MKKRINQQRNGKVDSPRTTVYGWRGYVVSLSNHARALPFDKLSVARGDERMLPLSRGGGGVSLRQLPVGPGDHQLFQQLKLEYDSAFREKHEIELSMQELQRLIPIKKQQLQEATNRMVHADERRTVLMNEFFSNEIR